MNNEVMTLVGKKKTGTGGHDVKLNKPGSGLPCVCS